MNEGREEREEGRTMEVEDGVKSCGSSLELI